MMKRGACLGGKVWKLVVIFNDLDKSLERGCLLA